VQIANAIFGYPQWCKSHVFNLVLITNSRRVDDLHGCAAGLRPPDITAVGVAGLKSPSPFTRGGRGDYARAPSIIEPVRARTSCCAAPDDTGNRRLRPIIRTRRRDGTTIRARWPAEGFSRARSAGRPTPRLFGFRAS
jgi:hypothetical protein